MLLDEYLAENQSVVDADSEEKCFDVLRQCVEAGYCFRGVTDAEDGLLSTLDRYGPTLKAHREQYLIREFQRRLHHYLRVELLPSTTFELLSLMQHYGVPTKLLDFTYSPYVALYFAVYDTKEERDCAIWAVLPFNLHSKSYRRLVDGGFPHRLRKDAYFSEQFVEEEYFTEAFMHHKYGIAMLLQPELMNERLSVQQGLFLVTDGKEIQRSSDPVQNVGEFQTVEETVLDLLQEGRAVMIAEGATDPTLLRIVVPGRLKARLMKALELMNINACSLFPGLDGFARYIKERVRGMSGLEMAPYLKGHWW
jgi:hypothetical protein